MGILSFRQEMNQSVQDTIVDILKKHTKSYVKSLTFVWLKKIMARFGIEITCTRKTDYVKAIIDSVGEQNFTTTTGSNDAKLLKDEIIIAFNDQNDDEEEEEVDEGDDSNKRKREEDSC